MINKTRPWILLLAVFATVLAACGGGAKTGPAAEFEDQPWEVRVESPLDTVEIVTHGEGAEELEAYDPDPPEGPIVETPMVTETKPKAPPKAEEFTPGWRVQIFASSSMVNADALAKQARARFSEPVYVEYEPPLYKVRIGDFLTKNEARHMQNRAKAEDFDAWIVEALVVRPSR